MQSSIYGRLKRTVQKNQTPTREKVGHLQVCGICGIFELSHQNPPPVHILASMNQALVHRGPDDGGTFVQGPVALGHRRLSIIDLSSAGHQPMPSSDQNLWIVYNGEIYNYLELKTELKNLGYSFKTGTDTEVILAAYQAYGPECTSKFNGMWAFAIWDQAKQTLFCSRDRFGIKPFYYVYHRDRFVFASEIKALLKHPDISKDIDPFVAYRFLKFGQSNIGSESFYSDIRQLKPGHYLHVNQSGIFERCYWDLHSDIEQPPITIKSAAEKFEALLTDSVRLTMRSDVPIGTCLSGGLDSSALVCIAHQLNQRFPSDLYQQETFSSCFEEKKYDEREFIETVIQQTGAKKNYVFPSPAQFLQDLSLLVRAQDEPFTSLSIFAQWSVMKKVQERSVSVLLDGQGADELLAGYGYDSLFWAELLNNQDWQSLSQEIRASLNKHGLYTTAKRIVSGLLPLKFKDLKNAWPSHQLLASEFESEFTSHNFHQEKEKKYNESLKNELYFELKNRLPTLLRYEDRNSMAFSIESRVPFLDHRLVEFVFSLPDTYIIHQGWSKWIFRKAMAGILPERIRWRQDKMGFVTPQELWYKKELAPFIFEILHDRQFQQRAYWNGKKILKSYQDYIKKGDLTILSSLWRYISMELWIQEVQSN
jgi:asparagine synthase (glutamine-hydrolysing)